MTRLSFVLLIMVSAVVIRTSYSACDLQPCRNKIPSHSNMDAQCRGIREAIDCIVSAGKNNPDCSSVNASIDAEVEDLTRTWDDICSVAAGQHCLKDWKFFNGSYYCFMKDLSSWREGQLTCQYNGGKLVEIESREENDFIKNMVKDKQVQEIFLGGRLNGNSWLWESTRKPIELKDIWGPNTHIHNQKNPGDDCVGLSQKVNYDWTVIPCDFMATVLCELREAPLIEHKESSSVHLTSSLALCLGLSIVTYLLTALK